ncbi:hypothetical protein CHUAL_009987 [Chamberlinius hualienensis]
MRQNQEYAIQLFLLILIISFDDVASAQQSRVTKNSVNRFADAAIRRIKDNTIKSETEPIPVQGVGPYGDGQFSGLSSIRRKSNAVFNRFNSTVKVSTSLSHDTKLLFPCTIMFFGKNVCGSEATFRFDSFEIDLTFNSKLSSDGLPQLKICDVKNPFGRSALQMGPEGNTNPILSLMGGWFSTFSRYQLTSNLQDSLCNAIATNS